MKKRFLAFAGVALLGLTLTGCSIQGKGTNKTTGNGTVVTTPEASQTAADPEASKTEITEAFLMTTEDGTFTEEDGIYTITAAGTYTVSGLLSEGQVVVNAPECEVTIELSGAEIICSKNSPIYCTEAEELKIKAIEGTYNEIQDTRSTKTEDADDQGEGAIYAKCDLKLVGKGYLVVSGAYNNGVATTKDLEIKNVTLKSTAYNNSLKGNDSLTIESGEITAISSGGDGLKTEDSDISSKGNQRGTITISGGVVDIYSCCDGIDASYNADITGDAVVNIYTDKYSTYSGTVAATSTDLYIASSLSNSSYRFAVYFYNDDAESGKWVDASYSTSSSGSTMGGRPGQSRNVTYYYKLSEPSGYQNLKVCMFEASETTDSFDTALATTSGQTINTNKDLFTISSVSSGSMSGSWGTYTVTSQQSGGGMWGGGEMSGGNTQKSDYSAKGIKADNEINVSGGTILIESYDDGLHANQGTTLENGSTGTGNVNISGGYLTITAADDGIHADNTVTIDDGTIQVVTAYEGVEGNLIYFNGGSTTVYATDDGVNASSGSATPNITVTGGYLDVTVPSGDVDGIDSNGTYKQTGGFVVTRDGTSDTSGNAGALDTDSSVTITGGTLVCVGSSGTTPTNSQNWVSFGSSSSRGGMGGFGGSSGSSTTFSAGTYTISGTSIEFTLSSSYNGLWICSDELKSGTSYTLTGGTTKTWTQSSGKTQVS